MFSRNQGESWRIMRIFLLICYDCLTIAQIPPFKFPTHYKYRHRHHSKSHTAYDTKHILWLLRLMECRNWLLLNDVYSLICLSCYAMLCCVMHNQKKKICYVDVVWFNCHGYGIFTSTCNPSFSSFFLYKKPI